VLPVASCRLSVGACETPQATGNQEPATPEGKGVEWTFKPNSVFPRALARTRDEDHSSAVRVATAVEQPTRTLERTRASPLRPYLVLLRRGFAMPSTLTCDAVRSYRTVSPLPLHLAMKVGGLFSVALSVALPRLAVSQPAARRSSDFPR